MIIIGLTGSIGTGKSTVTQQFAQLGAATFDSDKVVHRLLEKGGVAVKPVAKLFPEALDEEKIDRKKLGAQVFGKPDKLKQLEAVIHPLVRQAQDHFILQARRRGIKLVVLDIPLLFETQGETRCDYTVVTMAPFFLQRQRVLKRSNMTEEKFFRILSAQMPAAEKRRRGNFVVHTGSGKAASLVEVKRILLRLQKKDGSMKP